MTDKPDYYDEFGFYSPMPNDRAARREPNVLIKMRPLSSDVKLCKSCHDLMSPI